MGKEELKNLLKNILVNDYTISDDKKNKAINLLTGFGGFVDFDWEMIMVSIKEDNPEELLTVLIELGKKYHNLYHQTARKLDVQTIKYNRLSKLFRIFWKFKH